MADRQPAVIPILEASVCFIHLLRVYLLRPVWYIFKLLRQRVIVESVVPSSRASLITLLLFNCGVRIIFKLLCKDTEPSFTQKQEDQPTEQKRSHGNPDPNPSC